MRRPLRERSVRRPKPVDGLREAYQFLPRCPYSNRTDRAPKHLSEGTSTRTLPLRNLAPGPRLRLCGRRSHPAPGAAAISAPCGFSSSDSGGWAGTSGAPLLRGHEVDFPRAGRSRTPPRIREHCLIGDTPRGSCSPLPCGVPRYRGGAGLERGPRSLSRSRRARFLGARAGRRRCSLSPRCGSFPLLNGL